MTRTTGCTTGSPTASSCSPTTLPMSRAWSADPTLSLLTLGEYRQLLPGRGGGGLLGGVGSLLSRGFETWGKDWMVDGR